MKHRYVGDLLHVKTERSAEADERVRSSALAVLSAHQRQDPTIPDDAVERRSQAPLRPHSGARRPQLRPPRTQSGGAAAPDWAHPAHDRAQPCTRLGSDWDHSGARSCPDRAPIGITVGSAGPNPGPVVRPIGITVGSAAPILGPAVPPIGITVGTAAPTSGSESGPADPNVDPTLGSRHLLCPRHLAWRPFLALLS